MHQCLRVEEVVTRICDEFNRSSALAMGLTKKAFFEPAMDRCWRDLTSFRPLVACLPEDLLEEEPVEQGSNRPPRMMQLRRMVSMSDLQRYIDIYARRVRSFRPHPHDEAKHWLSNEALRAIQLVTGSQPGALTPLLKTFHMTTPGKYRWHLHHSFANQLAPCMGLFIGPHVENLQFTVLGDCYLYCNAIKSFTDSTNLKRLTIYADGEDFVQDYLTTYSWGHLQEITLCSGPCELRATGALMRHLSSLPLLTKLDMTRIDLSQLREDQAFSLSGDCFPSLRHLRLAILPVPRILQCLPPTNQVACLEYHSVNEVEDIIAAIGTHCNPLALKALEIKEPKVIWPLFQEDSRDEGLDPQHSEISIEPLLKFRLQYVDLHVSKPIQVTPSQVERLSTTWQSVKHIHLYSLWTTTSNPLIDHSHILAIANSCKSLVHLGLRFDASRITSETTVTTPGHRRLRKLYVGDSPIYSPSAVRGFLNAAFPSLKDIRYRSGCNWNIPIFKDRWKDLCGDDYTRTSWAQ